MFLFSALFLGFIHSFEADHLAAVVNLVSTKHKENTSYKDGFFWGIGHTLTIFVVATVVLLFKFSINEKAFEKLEIIVGFMLIAIAVYKFYGIFCKKEKPISHAKHMATGMGIVHGIAGSGAVVVLAVSQSPNVLQSIFYLILFGIGSIAGMFLASTVLSKVLNFSEQKMKNIVWFFSIVAALISLLLGLKILNDTYF